MARRNKHSLAEIREMVLDAAETIIINEGYSALKVRRIAMDIGYTVGSVYMVFDNMADLVIHIKANTVDNLTEQLQQVPDCVPEQYIAELAKAYLQFSSRNFNRWSMIFVQDAEIPEWYRHKINQISSQIEAPFAKLAPSCSTQQHKQAARALWSGVHGICTLSLTGKQNAEDISDMENTVELLVESFIGGWVGSFPSKNQQR
ncbi:MAG: TetR/AcrR family transcriptional regulator [Methylobacter sp.]|nr:TetR/AcrR family transcriptional regulator [Methylobacter sp.]